MEKPIVFGNKNGKQLVGILHLPAGKGLFPLVVACHGFAGTKTSKKFVRLARFLAKNGIASFRFDFEGCGDSEGDTEAITVKRQVADLASAMNWLLSQKEINKDRVALVGHSLGAIVATLYAAQTKFPAKAFVLWAPAFDQKGLMLNHQNPRAFKAPGNKRYFVRKEDKIGMDYLKENQDKNYSPILTEIQAPILIIHGKRDDIVPIKFSRKLKKKYKNIQLSVLPKADHRFNDYYIQQELIKETTKWLKRYLRR